MGARDIPLPRQFELLLGKDRDRWPSEARFIEAAHLGDVRDIKKIAKELDVHGHGIPVTVANTTYMGMNALHAAGGHGKLPAYQYLVEEVKMDVNKPDTSQDFSPVEHALTYANLPAVKYLLDHGANLHQKRSGKVTLHSAAIHGHCEIVKFLLSRGTDVDAVSVTGTPLCLAAFKGHASTVKILLQHNADALKMDNFDAKLLSNRSLCFLRMGDGQRAYEDATECKELRPKWSKAYYRLGAALMFMKDYDSAYNSLSHALELDPESEEVEKLFWEAMERRS